MDSCGESQARDTHGGRPHISLTWGRGLTPSRGKDLTYMVAVRIDLITAFWER